MNPNPPRPVRRTVTVTFTALDGSAQYAYDVEGIFADRVLAHFAWRRHGALGLPDVDLINPSIEVIDAGS